MTFRELAPSLYGIVLGFKDFFLWWRSELTRSVPSFVASRIQMRSVSPTLVTVSRDGCKLGGYPDRFPLAELGVRLQALEAGNAVGGDGIHVHLAPDRCLRRTVSPRLLPISALYKAAELDVETQTPFTRDSVHIFVADQGAASAYYLVRRNILSELQEQLRSANLALHAISTAGEDGSLVRLTLNGASPEVGWRPSLHKAVLAGTVAATAAFLISSWYQLHSKTDAAVTHLDAVIARAEGEARQARRSYDAYVARISQVAELRSERLGPRATVMWEELSRIVPDSSYLTNLTTKDGTVEISGFSRASSELIPLIEGSALFEAAQFVSPVVKVPGFDGDRYTISFKLSGAKQ
ncbi:PilN domain-containing protein [Sinorhizobium meliloti]|uniref:PilN domain-containing protein n=1 Tax=Rhizobium meliloti TaxID=382 RepID=UPI00047FC283|nr:PilN domain-containing protein [Sinorhizobium meliloti]RVJ06867.1 general secretion pathway protein GspL [Sinorhizobium meliloti]